MKKVFFILLVLLQTYISPILAQNGALRVDTFHLALGDARATGKDAVMDYGEPPRPCALIIVHLPLEGASVEKNRLGIVSIKNMPNNEIWVYAPAGTGGPDRIVVKHPNYQDLKVELGDWLESDGEGYLSSGAVYHLRIHVPSALLTLAEQKLARLDFKGADDCYLQILDNSSLDLREKQFAQERRKHLQDWDNMLTLALKYERKYIKDKEKEANKTQIVSDLDSIVHWYRILYKHSGIQKSQARMNKASDILSEIIGKTTIKLSFKLIEKKGRGQYIQRKPQKLKDIQAIITKANGITEKLLINETDGSGVSQISVMYSPENRIKFSYEEKGRLFESTEYSVTGDCMLNINLQTKTK